MIMVVTVIISTVIVIAVAKNCCSSTSKENDRHRFTDGAASVARESDALNPKP